MLLDKEKLFQQANSILHDEGANFDKLGHAFDIVTSLLNSDAKNPLLLFTLGTLAMRKKQNALAILFYELTITLSQKVASITSWINLGIIHKLEERRGLAKACWETALKLIPEDHGDLKEHLDQCILDCMVNLNGLHVSGGDPEEGLKMVEEIEKRWPEKSKLVNLTNNKSLILLALGRYGEGFDCYDENKKRNPGTRSYPGEIPMWDGTKGKTVIVTGEQGIGDEIMFASVLPDLMKDCNVILDAHMRLADIFRRSFGIKVYGTREFSGLQWREDADYKIPIGSLCKYYRRSKEDFPGTPYLKVDEQLNHLMQKRLSELGTKPKIGISWRGGTKETNKAARKIQLDQLTALFKSVDVDWISLQYQETSGPEVEEYSQRTGIKIHHWKDAIDNYDMTAALVNNLDLVISIPQSVVHLAGALGTQTWQLCPKQAMWQMGVHGEDMPWYKSVKNFWQEKDGVWEPTLNKVQTALSDHLSLKEAA